MIPEEAVEAAAKVVLSGMDERHHAYKIAYAALEAAAPYMLRDAKAEAWDEGSQARWEYQWSDDIDPLTNPYRSQA